MVRLNVTGGRWVYFVVLLSFYLNYYVCFVVGMSYTPCIS